MFKKSRISILISLSLPLFAAPMVQADISMSYSNPTQPNERMTLTVTNNRAAMELPNNSGESSRMIYDHSENKLFMVMDSRKQYMDMDVMMKSLGGLSDMLSGMMKNLPEESQGQLGGILGGLTGQADKSEVPEAEMTETGQTDEVMGVSCEIVTMNSPEMSTEMCLADHDDVGISDNDFAIMQGMMVKQQESAKQAGDMIGISSLEFSPGALDRVPLRMRQLSGPEAGTASEIVETSKSVDPSKVVIPDEYQPMNMSLPNG